MGTKNYVTKKNFVSFNFIKHWPIQNLFNDEIFPIYSTLYMSIAEHHFEAVWHKNSKFLFLNSRMTVLTIWLLYDDHG